MRDRPIPRWQLAAGCAALALTAAGCAGPPAPARVPERTAAPQPAAAAAARADLPLRIRWQIQYSGELEIEDGTQLFNLDLLETPAARIAELHQLEIFVVCYFSAGSLEDWRPDASGFPEAVLGKDLDGWPGERWLDVSRADLILPLMESRLDLAVEKGCDGVDPDNVDGYQNDTGFELRPEDQLAFNAALAQAAHARGLAIGLKNDLDQIPQLLPDFDWALNEECFSYDECDKLLPFVAAGKPVFVIEYDLDPQDFCPQAQQLGFNAQHKRLALDAYAADCSGV